MENTQRKEITLKILFISLFFGAIWGIVEATLGTILHLPFFEAAGIYTKSSVIIVPIALALMAVCYKKTNSFLSILLMGLVAATIKLSVGFVIGFIDRVYFPAIYIVVEALMMGAMLKVFHNEKVLTLKTFGIAFLANTLYQFSYLVISSLTGGKNVFSSMELWQSTGEKYLFTYNCIAMLYLFTAGVIIYFVNKLVEKSEVKVKFDLQKIIFSPITASIALVIAFGLTIGLSFVK